MAEKSAGSVLYRGEIYYGATYGDSSLTPSLIDSPVSLKEIDKFHFFSIGPGVGYASTFVYKEHFFLLASANVNLTLRYSNEISTTYNQNASHPGFRPNFILHTGVGYNGPRWSLTLLWVDSKLLMRDRVRPTVIISGLATTG